MTKNQLLELYPVGNPIPDGRRYDPVSAIIGAGANIIGGVIGAGSASRAAKLQAESAAKAGQGIEDTTKAVRQDQLDAATRAGDKVTGAAGLARSDVASAANQAAFNVTDAATGANKLLDPYAGAGADASDTLRAGLVAGGDFNKTPTLADLQLDPGYAFRQQQGEQALQRAAAARGGLMGGGFAKDITNYSQGAASQEYKNAFDRFQTSTQNRFGNLNTVANRGAAAAGQQGANMTGAARYGGDITTGAAKYGGDITTGAAQYAGNADINAYDRTSDQAIAAARAKGDYLTQQGNAKAAGAIGVGNAFGGGIVGAGNAITGQRNLNTILTNPAFGYNRINPTYASNPLGNNQFGAGPMLPPLPGLDNASYYG